jgi:hypothetical protein
LFLVIKECALPDRKELELMTYSVVVAISLTAIAENPLLLGCSGTNFLSPW